MKKDQKNKIKTVVGYCRVSTHSQAVEGESLELQKQEISNFANSKNWELVDIYEDAGISGFNAESRPSFKKMVGDAGNSEFQGIVFSKLSRFAVAWPILPFGIT